MAEVENQRFITMYAISAKPYPLDGGGANLRQLNPLLAEAWSWSGLFLCWRGGDDRGTTFPSGCGEAEDNIHSYDIRMAKRR